MSKNKRNVKGEPVKLAGNLEITCPKCKEKLKIFQPKIPLEKDNPKKQ